MSAPTTMEVQAGPLQQVFFGGYLLPEGAARIEQSPVQFTVCDLTIIKDHPRMPSALRAVIDTIKPDATELPEELQGPQAFLAIPAVVAGQSHPTLIRMQVRGIKLVKFQKPKADA